MDDIAIKVDNISKNFNYTYRKVATVKSAFTGILKRQETEEKTIQHALNDVSFEVKKGEFFGIVGRNGSGKSTLLKMLAGIYQPNKGKLQIVGKLVPFIELGVGFNPELTGRENVYLNGALLGFSEKEVARFYDEVVEFAELEQYMDKKLKNYSSGMQVRLAFSMAIRAKADILLIDEVLAVGDADFQHKCFNYFRQLKKQKATVVFVSHDMSAVREYCDRVILIDEGEVRFDGKPDRVADEYAKLFINNEKTGRQTEALKRSGNGRVLIKKVKKIPTIHSKTATPIIEFTVEAQEDVDSVVAGFKCKNAADTPIFGTNTSIESKTIGRLDKGHNKIIKFVLPNIFNNGTYFADISLESSDGEMYDWIQDAVRFDVKTEKRTGYLVEIPIKVEVSNA